VERSFIYNVFGRVQENLLRFSGIRLDIDQRAQLLIKFIVKEAFQGLDTFFALASESLNVSGNSFFISSFFGKILFGFGFDSGVVVWWFVG
jgi:hypothetical protein